MWGKGLRTRPMHGDRHLFVAGTVAKPGVEHNVRPEQGPGLNGQLVHGAVGQRWLLTALVEHFG